MPALLSGVCRLAGCRAVLLAVVAVCLRLPAPVAVACVWASAGVAGAAGRCAHGWLGLDEPLETRKEKRLQVVGQAGWLADGAGEHACPAERPPKVAGPEGRKDGRTEERKDEAAGPEGRKGEAGTRTGLQGPRVEAPVPHGSRLKTQAGRGRRRAFKAQVAEPRAPEPSNAWLRAVGNAPEEECA